MALIAGCNNKPETAVEAPVAAATTDAKPAPAEFADPKYMEMGKKMTAQMASGDVEGFASGYADNAKYRCCLLYTSDAADE